MSEISDLIVSPLAAQAGKTRQQTDDERLLEALAMLGGSRIADEDLIFEGDQLIIPARWTARDALKYLRNHIEQQEEETEFERVYRYRPYDGAHALQAALKRVFGTAGLGKPIYTFFGKIPPRLISVPTGPTSSEQVPWGVLAAPLFGGTIMTGEFQDPEYGPLFQLTVTSKRKHKAHVEGLFTAIGSELAANSIYKGKAINGATQPEFLDLRGVDHRKVIYSDEVQTQIEANVWALLEYTEQMRRMGLPLKRAVLFEGDYGTGKTLGAFLTAQIAEENGWTFVYCRPGRDDFQTVMNTARLYQPAVVFFEDVDAIAEGGDRDYVSRLLDTFDGITAKGTELLCILTTNHKERIVKAMLRPGRVSSVIHFGGLDEQGISKMAYANLGSENIAPDVDWAQVAEAMGVGTDKAFLPAFAKEALDRAMRYGMARSGGEVDLLETTDFVHAARGLQPQLDLMLDADEGKTPDPLERAYARATRSALDGTQIKRTGDGGLRAAPWAQLDTDHENSIK